MARRCSVCAHPQSHQINTALLGGASIRDISGRFHLSRTAVGNHSANHLRQRIAEGAQAMTCAAADPDAAEAVALAREVRRQGDQRQAENVSLRQHLADDLARLDRLYAVAVASGNVAAATKAIATRWGILARAGLLADLDATPMASPEKDRHAAGADMMRAVTMELFEDIRRLKGMPGPGAYLEAEEIEEEAGEDA